MRCAAEAAEKAAKRVIAASLDDALSTAALTLSAAPVAAVACGVSPRAIDVNGSQVELFFSGESDGGPDSKKTPRSFKSQSVTEYWPTNWTRAGCQAHYDYKSLFRPEDEFSDSSLRLLLHMRFLANAVLFCIVVILL
uniref:Uncharacterized protein n=1 Tax=Peronospora matthiolae TaxID=2874970 RepID=A0AAV1U4P3_9STRA